MKELLLQEGTWQSRDEMQIAVNGNVMVRGGEGREERQYANASLNCQCLRSGPDVVSDVSNVLFVRNIHGSKSSFKKRDS